MRFPIALVATIAVGLMLWVPEPRSASAQPQTEVTLSGASHAFGVIGPGEQTATQSFTVDGARTLQLVIVSPIRLGVEITLPDGLKLTPANASLHGVKIGQSSVPEKGGLIPVLGLGIGENLVAIFPSPPPGNYTISVDAGAVVSERTPFVVSVYLESDVNMAVSVPEPETITGSPILLTAILLEGTRAISGATVTASVVKDILSGLDKSPPEAIPQLFDDGLGADSVGGDGVYTGLVPDGLPPGAYTAFVHAEGRSATGNAFRRDSSAGLRVTERTSKIIGVYASSGVDDNGDGFFDRLRVSMEADIEGASEFNLSLLLGASNGESVGSNWVGPLTAGMRRIDVDVPADYILSLGADGPYTISMARLDEMTASERLLRDRKYDLGSVEGFKLSQFEGYAGTIQPSLPGDLDRDGDVDQNDLNILLSDRDKTVAQSSCGAPCDLDGDGRITALDSRKLVLLCTRPRCATN